MNFDKIKELIIDIISCDDDEVSMGTDLKEDLGMDSLDAMELAMAIKEKLGVEVPEEKLAEVVTVEDIVTYVDDALEK